MIHAGARIVDQLVALVLPNHPLYLQRRAALHVTPAVAPVAGVERVLHDVKTSALQSQRHGEKVLELNALELVVDHLVQCFQQVA